MGDAQTSEGPWHRARARRLRNRLLVLTHLRRFNLDYLKIDKSFVDGLGPTSEDTAIIEHVIGLAHTLGLKVVAEGIEAGGAVQGAARVGCDYAAGLLLQPTAAGQKS